MSLEHITEAQIAAAGVASAPDIVTGTPSEVKAIFDNLVRAVVATAVNLVIDEVTRHEADTANPHAATKAQVGLGLADNTADADKPVSGPQRTALNQKADRLNVLERDNLAPYTPTADYHPATKRYTDEAVAGVTLGQIPDGGITYAKLERTLRGYLYAVIGGQRGDGALEDVSLECGSFENAGAGWNTFHFRETFDAPPTVTVQPEDFSGWVEIKSVTAEGFLYCLRRNKLTSTDGTATTGTFYTGPSASGTTTSVTSTLVKAVTFPADTLDTETVADAVKLQYIAIEQGGERQ